MTGGHGGHKDLLGWLSRRRGSTESSIVRLPGLQDCCKHCKQAISDSTQGSRVAMSGGAQSIVVLPTSRIKRDTKARPMEDRLSDPVAARASHADRPSPSTLLGNGSAAGIAPERVIVSFSNRTCRFSEDGGCYCLS
jgi:hypothetical protein